MEHWLGPGERPERFVTAGKRLRKREKLASRRRQGGGGRVVDRFQGSVTFSDSGSPEATARSDEKSRFPWVGEESDALPLAR